MAFKSSSSVVPLQIKFDSIKNRRRELSSNTISKIRQVPFKNPLPITKIPSKSKLESTQATIKPLLKTPETVLKQPKPVKMNLNELNDYKPLKKVYNTSGLVINAQNSSNYVFHCICFYNSICSCDKSAHTSSEEFYDKLIDEGFKCSKEWVSQHYRLLVWKYASYERRLAKYKGAFCVKKIYEALKKRFQVEIGEGRRSILKAIIDGDEHANKRMVLCVGIIKQETPNYKLELTDG